MSNVNIFVDSASNIHTHPLPPWALALYNQCSTKKILKKNGASKIDKYPDSLLNLSLSNL
jgi:hypothetical protein